MENKKTFGEYVRAKRTEANYTQKEFAELLYVTESAVSKWERGLSYPDITLITEICRLLNVTEHELFTTSTDIKTRNQEKLAGRYLRLIKRIKIAQYILYGVSLLICFIVNLAVDKTLSWFFIVLTSEMVAASLTLLPLIAEKKRGLVTLGGFAASLGALLAVCAIYTGGNWFLIAFVSVIFGLSVLFMPFVIRNICLPSPLENHKAVITLGINTALLYVLLLTADVFTGGGWFLTIACPMAAFWLVLPWGYTLIIRYARINRFFKTAGCLAVTSAVYYFMRDFMEMLIGQGDYNEFNAKVDSIIFFSTIALTLVFAVAGVTRQLTVDN